MADLRNQPPIPPGERLPIPTRVSQTFLQHYSRCQRAAFLYGKYRGGAGSVEMERGTAGHRAAELMALTVLEREETHIPPEIARDILEEVMADPAVSIAPEETDGLRMMVYHLAEDFVIEPGTIVGVEKKVILPNFGDSGVDVVCKLDLAWVKDRKAGVRDYKFSPNLPDNSGWGPATTAAGKKRVRKFAFQTLLYAVALKYGYPAVRCPVCAGDRAVMAECGTCYGAGEMLETEPLAPRAEEFLLELVFPFHMNDETGIPTRSTPITGMELVDHKLYLEGLVRKAVESFGTGLFPALPGQQQCGMCPSKLECPLPAHLREERIEIVDGASAQAAVALSDRLGDEKKLLDAQIKAWAMTGEEIVVGDKRAGFKNVVSTSVRKRGQNADWEGLRAAIQHSLETGEEFLVDEWLKVGESSRFGFHTMSPAELEQHYEKEGSDDGRSAGADYGDEAPF